MITAEQVDDDALESQTGLQLLDEVVDFLVEGMAEVELVLVEEVVLHVVLPLLEDLYLFVQNLLLLLQPHFLLHQGHQIHVPLQAPVMFYCSVFHQGL